MVISNYGTRTIIAHHLPHFRGLNFSLASEEEFGQDGLAVVFDSIRREQPAVARTGNTMIVSYPYDIGSIRAPWTVITAVPLSTIRAPIYALIRFSIIFITMAGMVAAGVIFFTSNSLTRRARSLQYELEKAMTMWDNLKYGFFLMDQNFVIQGSYSRALEEILAVSGLQGKQFVGVLSDSLKASEQQGLTDYFTMVFQRSFDEKMLEDINPINEFVYVQSGTGKEKYLRSSFTLVERGKGVAYILGTLEDVTMEKELERQLSEAENRRENEMRSLFQVIQIDPRVFSDFIEETEHEFDRVNEALKNREVSARDTMVDIYQSIHAIKSNALILNLEDFSGSLNNLEAQIKQLRDRPEGPSAGGSGDISFDDVLHIIVELEKIMKEKDKLKSAISRIRAFQVDAGNTRSQDRYILVETLTRTCDKTALATNKKARFITGDIDETVLAYGPRLVIKEVLAQLVRNGVYHGIETPDEREARGKAAAGLIKLSIKHIDNMIHIKLADDGEGLDFAKIREKAKTMHMLRSGEETDDEKLLHVIFKPGFTTVEEADVHAGRGIGLSLVRDRIRDLHGSIKVQSMPGKGTIFNIYIPMDVPAANKVS
jgi:two-component system chemotaxis sensor kinase CheA